MSAELASRANQGLGPLDCPGVTTVPDVVQIDDGITADEAVTTALWNNAAFQEALTLLGVSRARLLDAGLLPDPQVQIFFPVGVKQFELTGYQAIDALWLRGIRERAAELDLTRVADQMVQNGLNLIRDVRSAHADLLMTQQQLKLAEEMLTLRNEIARLAYKRAAAGDISEFEATAPQIEALQAETDRTRIVGDVEAARVQLLILMGLPGYGDEMVAVGLTPPVHGIPSAEDLVAEALSVRPDLWAAEINIQAADQRLKLAKCQWIALDGILDMNGKGLKGFEAGPGTRFTIPIFNGNQGNIAIAEADLETANRQFVTLRDQIRNDVLTARVRLVQAIQNLSEVQVKVLPATKNASELAQKNFEGGGSSYYLTLQTLGQYITAQVREAELTAAVQRSLAELERGVGHQVDWTLGFPENDGIVPEPEFPELKPNPNPTPPAPADGFSILNPSRPHLPACRPVSFESTR